jgi:hypothetical protein
MAAFFKIPVSIVGAVVRPEQQLQAASCRARDVSAPVAVLAHRTSDRFRLRIEGRQAGAFLQLAASELAWSPDVLKLRINAASASLTLWVRDGSDLAAGDGERVVALVCEALRRIALGQRACAAPIENARDDGLGFGLSLLKAVAA